MKVKKNRISTRVAWLLLASVMIVTLVAAEDSGSDGAFDLSWNTIDGGGGTSTGGSFELSGTIGQPDALSVAMTGGGFELVGGFWAATGVVIPSCVGDVSPTPNGDGLVNVNDLLAVINGWGNCPAPPAACPADITLDGVVNVNDLLSVINHWGICP